MPDVIENDRFIFIFSTQFKKNSKVMALANLVNRNVSIVRSGLKFYRVYKFF